MPTVQTVRGPVHTSALGVTLMHEHLNFRTFPCNCPAEFLDSNRTYHYRLIQDALDVGINTLVDCGPFPDVPEVVKLSDAFPQLNIVLSTGAYVEGADQPVKGYSEDEMVRHMVHNIKKGYQGHEKTGLKAGIIKVAGNTSTLTD